ncbi:MAG: hypothetical protein IKM08_05295, partial [Clostridia bacterium]|nr:hypothetical protein [Clostridia bacterium]
RKPLFYKAFTVRDVEAAGSNPVISTKKGKGSLLPFPFFVETHRFRASQIACDLTARARGERWIRARKWRTQRFVNPVISTKKGKGSLLPFPFFVEIHRFKASQIACDLTARARGSDGFAQENGARSGL